MLQIKFWYFLNEFILCQATHSSNNADHQTTLLKSSKLLWNWLCHFPYSYILCICSAAVSFLSGVFRWGRSKMLPRKTFPGLSPKPPSFYICDGKWSVCFWVTTGSRWRRYCWRRWEREGEPDNQTRLLFRGGTKLPSTYLVARFGSRLHSLNRRGVDLSVVTQWIKRNHLKPVF